MRHHCAARARPRQAGALPAAARFNLQTVRILIEIDSQLGYESGAARLGRRSGPGGRWVKRRYREGSGKTVRPVGAATTNPTPESRSQRRYVSAELFADSRDVEIEHAGEICPLRCTS